MSQKQHKMSIFWSFCLIMNGGHFQSTNAYDPTSCIKKIMEQNVQKGLIFASCIASILKCFIVYVSEKCFNKHLIKELYFQMTSIHTKSFSISDIICLPAWINSALPPTFPPTLPQHPSNTYSNTSPKTHPTLTPTLPPTLTPTLPLTLTPTLTPTQDGYF